MVTTSQSRHLPARSIKDRWLETQMGSRLRGKMELGGLEPPTS